MKLLLSQIQKKYRLGFSLRSLIFYLCQLLPNIIWWAHPPENDVLSANASPHMVMNAAEHVFGVAMMAALVLIVRRDNVRNHSAFLLAAILALLVYYVCWVMYYMGNVNPYMFVFGFALMPVAAFGTFGVWTGNYIMLAPLLVFAAFHLTITCGTFL